MHKFNAHELDNKRNIHVHVHVHCTTQNLTPFKNFLLQYTAFVVTLLALSVFFIFRCLENDSMILSKSHHKVVQNLITVLIKVSYRVSCMYTYSININYVYPLVNRSSISHKTQLIPFYYPMCCTYCHGNCCT